MALNAPGDVIAAGAKWVPIGKSMAAIHGESVRMDCEIGDSVNIPFIIMALGNAGETIGSVSMLFGWLKLW